MRGCACVFYMTPESRKKTLPARLWANLLYVMPVTSGHYTHVPSKNAKTFLDLRGLFSYDMTIFSTFSVFVLRYWIPKLWDNWSDSIFLMLWRLEATVITSSSGQRPDIIFMCFQYLWTSNVWNFNNQYIDLKNDTQMQVHSWPCKFMHGQLSKDIIKVI